MKIVFMGTPEFACKPLEVLCQSKHEIVAVVTGDDKPQGRGKKMQSTAVCSAATCVNLKVIKAKSLKSDFLYEQLKALDADIFIVIAFRILPQKLIDIPRIGAINIHASLLPKYRGAAPINWALVNGEKETGLTSFFLKKTVDTGDIILQKKLTILPNENFDSLHNRLSDISGDFLLESLDLIETGNYELITQDETQVSPAPKIKPFDALIDFGFPAEQIVNFVRGMSTRPGAYTFHNNKKLKVLSAIPVSSESIEPYINELPRPGTVINVKKKLWVSCSNGAVEITQVQPEGKKVMDGKSYINGCRLQCGALFGEITQGVKE
ncbi:MAG: methionyl-tRNA formyltransferase [candidate division Zixibacteria bacterium]|nr:methionyl-tRNA formyltransferase [candidate division Zixibacteria bacterium]